LQYRYYPSMNGHSETGQILAREHRDNVALLERVEQSLMRAPSGGALDADTVRLLRSLCDHAAHDLARHFTFEELELFPRMIDAGEGDLAELLGEEHAAIRAVLSELSPLVAAADSGPPDAEGSARSRRLALELVERLLAHIDKEELSLVPLLDDLLEEDADRALALGYASS
jgi:hemerythrin-like domain-containing protein